MLNIPEGSNLNVYHDDILDNIFQFVPNIELVLVCKKWYQIIVKKNNVCEKCNKIIKIYDKNIWETDECDVDCHMKHSELNYKILDIELVNIIPLKHIFNVLNKKNKIGEFVMIFKQNRIMHTQLMTNDRCSLFDITLNENYFSKYKIKTKKIFVGIQSQEFAQMLNHIDNDCKIYISVYNNYLTLGVLNSKYRYGLYDLPKCSLKIPKLNHSAEFSISSARLVNDLMKLKIFDNVLFVIENENLTLIGYNGIRSSSSNYIKIKHKITNLLSENFEINFEIKNLISNIIKNPYGNITLCLKKDYPLVISYDMNLFGKFHVYITPIK